MPELGRLHWALIGVVWLVAAFGSGALLAWLYCRLHAGLSFFKLWAFWSVVMSLAALLVFALGVV